MKIILICPTFNNEELTIKCFQSINRYVSFSQKITILWIDNGSTKQSKEEVFKKIKQLKNIQIKNVFLTENLGFIKAVNIGLKLALQKKFDYIGIINNDIEVSQNWLKNLYNGFKKDVKAVGSIAYNTSTKSIVSLQENEILNPNRYAGLSFQETNNQIKRFVTTDYILYDFDNFKDYQFIKTYVAYYAVLFDPSIFSEIGFLNQNFNLGYSDDTQFNFRITKAGYKIAKSLKSLVIHNSRSTFKKLYKDDEMIKKIQDGNRLQLKISKTLNKTNKKKYVIYTALIDDYDSLRSPAVFDLDNFDYICFTNSQSVLNRNVFPWTIIDIRKIMDGLEVSDRVKYARFFKTHPHYFFQNYQKSIWIDSNIDIIGKPLEYLEKLKNGYILIPDHPTRNDIYQEIEACNKLRKDSWDNLNKVQKFLISQGFPIQMTKLVQSGVIVRDHHNLKCMFLMEKWWDMIQKYSKRDQLSFNYVFWKYNGEYLSIPWDFISLKYFTTNYKHKADMK